jgi:hypothetical protein
MIWKYYSLFTHDKQVVFAYEKFIIEPKAFIEKTKIKYQKPKQKLK